MSYRSALGAMAVGAVIGSGIAWVSLIIIHLVCLGEPVFVALGGGVIAAMGGFLITMGVSLLGISVHALWKDL